MSADIVSPILQWLNNNPELAGLATFIISAGESVAIIGTIVPGSIMMTAIGALAGAGIIPLYKTVLWAILGAIVGDSISYWIGHYFKARLPSLWPFRHYPSFLETGEKFFHKYGSRSVFIGRFVGPVRALVPMIAGMLGMPPLRFTIANVASAIGWAPAYMLPGILLGAASLELPPDIAMHVILGLLLISLFIMLCLWFVYKLFQLINKQTEQLLNAIWQTMKKGRYLSAATVLLKHHDPLKTHGQLTLVLYFSLTSLLFFCLAVYVKWQGAQNIFVNKAIFHLFRSIRTPTMDSVMIDITLLGQKQIIFPVVIALFGWFILSKHWRAAFHALALGILSTGGVFITKYLIQSHRPWGIFQNVESYSMPSGHTTLATTVYMGIAFIIAGSIARKHRWIIYTPAILVTAAVGISRLYLGAHWFTDVLGGWLLSTALLMLIVLSYRRQREKPMNLYSISIVSMAALAITYTLFYYQYFTQLKINYAQLDWPTVEISLDTWWQKNQDIPALRVNVFGFPSQHINLEWAGDLQKITQTLRKEGWTTPPERNWISILHRISDVRSTQFLPLVSPYYLDKKPALILTRNANGTGKLLVLQLWNANRTFKKTHTPLWIGVVAIVPRSYSWLFKKHPSEIEMDPVLVWPQQTQATPWQWKMITLSTTKILLVK